MPVEPRWITKATDLEVRSGDGPFVCDFINAYGKITKDTVAGRVGEEIRLRDWQTNLLGHLFARRADGRRRFRSALIGMARKNGKSALGSGIALYGLLAEGEGAEVYSCAADRDQARIVFGVAKRNIELDPELSGITKLYRDAIEVPGTGSVYRVLSAEAFTKEGLSPTLVVFDEVHAQPNDELWNVMSLGSGARVDPMVLGITTAGVMSDSRGDPTLCKRMYDHGVRICAGEIDDPSFFFSWWAAADDCDHKDPASWPPANPGFGDLNDPEDFEASVRRTPEPEYRTKRCNQWVTSESTWLPHGAWNALDEQPQPVEGAEVVLGFDGSYRGDASALVGCTLDGHLFVVDVWENPGDPEWRVPREEVRARVAWAFERWKVLRLACDPPGWHRELEEWADTYGENVVIEWPTNVRTRMAPACNRFYTAVMEGEVTHDGNPVLARHIGNCATKETPQGTLITKEMGSRKIDAAVAAVVAYEQSQTLEPVAHVGWLAEWA